MARPRVPIDVQLAKHRRSKKEIEERTTIPIELGDGNIPLPEEIKNDTVALKKWRVLAKLYKGTSYITRADTEVIRRICMLYSSEAALWELFSSDELDYREKQKVHNQILSTSRHITDLEDRLFLNPVTRRRGLPPEQRTPPKSDWDDMGL